MVHGIKWNPIKLLRLCERKMMKMNCFCSFTGSSNQFELYAISPIVDTLSMVEFPKWQNKYGHRSEQIIQTMSMPKTAGSKSDWKIWANMFSFGLCWFEVIGTWIYVFHDVHRHAEQQNICGQQVEKHATVDVCCQLKSPIWKNQVVIKWWKIESEFRKHKYS